MQDNVNYQHHSTAIEESISRLKSYLLVQADALFFGTAT